VTPIFIGTTGDSKRHPNPTSLMAGFRDCQHWRDSVPGQFDVFPIRIRGLVRAVAIP
jgi:hypothetical protein